jgi:hypothetical protein
VAHPPLRHEAGGRIMRATESQQRCRSTCQDGRRKYYIEGVVCGRFCVGRILGALPAGAQMVYSPFGGPRTQPRPRNDQPRTKTVEVLNGLRGAHTLDLIRNLLVPFRCRSMDSRWGRMTQWELYEHRLIRLEPMGITAGLIAAAFVCSIWSPQFPLIAITPL